MKVLERKNGQAVIETGPCIGCGDRSVLTLDEKAVNRYLTGAYAQVAFPNLTAPERELIISGTHQECFDRLFPPDE